MPDLKLIANNESRYYDLSLRNGDFEITESFDTSLIVSLFTDQRADVSEVTLPQARRGWWGNETSDIPHFQIGSKLWLLYQSRIIANTLVKSENYAFLALQWLTLYAFSKKVEVNGAFTMDTNRLNNGVSLEITITNTNGATASYTYPLWLNTGT